jgi:hypothetical protein
MNTWGISGPRFLLLYAALFAVTLVGVVLALYQQVVAAPNPGGRRDGQRAAGRLPGPVRSGHRGRRRRLVVTVRLPGLGGRWLSLSLPGA